MITNILFIVGGIVLITIGLLFVDILEQFTTPEPEDLDNDGR